MSKDGNSFNWGKLPGLLGVSTRGNEQPSDTKSLIRSSSKSVADTFQSLLTTSKANVQPTSDPNVRRQLFTPPVSGRPLQAAPLERRSSVIDLLPQSTFPSPRGTEKNSSTVQHYQPAYQLSSALQRQEEINRLNAQLSRMNYLVNLANSIKNRNIEKAVEESKLQLKVMGHRIQDQQSEIAKLNESVGGLRTEVGEQKELSHRLTASLESQRNLLSKTILESRAEMERQCYLIDQQHKMVQRLLADKVRHDFLVDSGVLILSVYLSRSLLLGYPLEAVLWVIPNRKLRRWSRLLAKLVFIVRVFLFFKQLTIRAGVHSSIGSVGSYMHAVTEYMKSSRLLGSILDRAAIIFYILEVASGVLSCPNNV